MTHQVGVKGKKYAVPAFRFDDCIIIVMGKLVRIAEVFDQKWLLADILPDPHRILQQLRCADQIPDLFTFFQRVPDTKPRFDFYMEWDNVAAIPVSTHDNWFRRQISKQTRTTIRQSEKKGVTVRVEQYDERYVHGIMGIYDESRIRAGRKFPHYGKDFSTVREENGTYLERSTFLGAYFENEMIGYLKIVWDHQTAGIMEIVSKIAFRDKGPNNALLSEAVRLCAERGVKYLLYGHFIYGSKGEDSLTKFKKRNGFVSIDIPRYYVPLTLKGNIALRLGLHRDLRDFVPMWLRLPFIDFRRKWYGNQLNAD